LSGRMIRLNPGETKSGHGRQAPLTADTLTLLKTLREGKPDNALVFVREDGTPIRDFRGSWKKVTTAAGVPGLLVHDLRRSAVRRMVRRGVSERVAMAVTGHRTRIVFDRYDIVSEDDLRDAARKLEARKEDSVQATVTSLGTVKVN